MNSRRCGTRIRPSWTGSWRPATARIRMVTLAPERTGGLAAIRRIVDAGAVAAVGHTEATYAQARAAVDAGATVATHLFNAMRPVHHREPGPVLALMEDPAGDRGADHRRGASAPCPVPGREPQRRTGPGGAGDRRDGRGRDGRRGLPARIAGCGRRRRGRPSRRNGHHRGQHRDDGPRLPVRGREQRAAPRRGAAGRGTAIVGQPGPGIGPAGERGWPSVRPPTWWCSTPS